MKVIPIFPDLRPKFDQKPSAAVAVAVGAKPSATAVGFGLRSTPAHTRLPNSGKLGRSSELLSPESLLTEEL